MNCHGHSGSDIVTISLLDLPLETSHLPHVFSFFRAAPSAVAIQYKVVDAKRKTILGKRTVHLDKLSSKTDKKTDEERTLGAVEGWHSRMLRGFRSFGRSPSAGFGGLGSRRRSPLSSYGGAASRRRGLGVKKSSWRTPSTGSYSVANPLVLNGRFPGGFAKTSYGFSGAAALVAVSAGYPMAACSVASAKDCSTFMLNQHLINNMHDANKRKNANKSDEAQCRVGKWEGTCKECITSHRPYLCMTTGNPSSDMGRDDIMDAAFIPNEYESPLSVEITKVEGPDYVADKICSPKDKSSSWKPSVDSSMYLALTEVDALLHSHMADPWATPLGKKIMMMCIVLISCLCCCCAGLIYFAVKMESGPAE